MQASTSFDLFAAALGTHRGNPNAPQWPRYADPPASDVAPFRNRWDFEDRLRPGVVGVLDRLNECGEVESRRECVVTRGRKTGSPWWGFIESAVGDDAREQLLRLATRVQDIEIDGPTVTHKGERWRFTFTDEGNAEARFVWPRSQRLPRAEADEVSGALRELANFGRYGTGWHYWTDDEVTYGWTTSKDDSGCFWSFVWPRGGLPARRGQKMLTLLNAKDHRKKFEAEERAKQLYRDAHAAVGRTR